MNTVAQPKPDHGLTVDLINTAAIVAVLAGLGSFVLGIMDAGRVQRLADAKSQISAYAGTYRDHPVDWSPVVTYALAGVALVVAAAVLAVVARAVKANR